MKNVLICTILLISSGCILASPSHKRAAAAAHWGQDAVSTELKEEQPEATETAVINNDAAPEKEVRNEVVNNFGTLVEEPISNETVEVPSIQPITEEEEKSAVAKESDEVVEEIVVTEAAVATALAEQPEVDTPFPNIGKIQDIIEAGNSAMLGKVDLKNVSEKDILIAKEKDGDYHIHIRVPADKVTSPEDGAAAVPEISDTTDLMDVTEGTEDTVTESTDEEADATSTQQADVLISEKSKSTEEAEVETLKPETATEAEPNTWFRYNDGSLNYLAILAVMFFLFI
jgi:hypothetical protein